MGCEFHADLTLHPSNILIKLCFKYITVCPWESHVCIRYKGNYDRIKPVCRTRRERGFSNNIWCGGSLFFFSHPLLTTERRKENIGKSINKRFILLGGEITPGWRFPCVQPDSIREFISSVRKHQWRLWIILINTSGWTNKHTLISSQLLCFYSKVCFYCFFMVICRSGVTRLNTLRFHKTQTSETLMFCGSWWAVSKKWLCKNDGWLIPTRLNAHERKMFIESYKLSDEKGKRSIQTITKTSTPKWFTSFLD